MKSVLLVSVGALSIGCFAESPTVDPDTGAGDGTAASSEDGGSGESGDPDDADDTDGADGMDDGAGPGTPISLWDIACDFDVNWTTVDAMGGEQGADCFENPVMPMPGTVQKIQFELDDGTTKPALHVVPVFEGDIQGEYYGLDLSGFVAPKLVAGIACPPGEAPCQGRVELLVWAPGGGVLADPVMQTAPGAGIAPTELPLPSMVVDVGIRAIFPAGAEAGEEHVIVVEPRIIDDAG